MANYLCLVLLGYLGGFLLSRTLIEYPPPQEIYFRREFSSVLSIQDITRRDSLTWPVNNTCSDSGHRYKFSLRDTQSEQRPESQSKKPTTSCLLKEKLPQLWDGSICLTPDYDHLNLKALLCWEQLNHTKNDQPGNTMRQSWVLYELCLFLPIEREIGVELSGFVALIYGLDIYRDDMKV